MNEELERKKREDRERMMREAVTMNSIEFIILVQKLEIFGTSLEFSLLY